MSTEDPNSIVPTLAPGFDPEAEDASSLSEIEQKIVQVIDGHISLAEIVSRLGMPEAMISPVVKILEERGLVVLMDVSEKGPKEPGRDTGKQATRMIEENIVGGGKFTEDIDRIGLKGSVDPVDLFKVLNHLASAKKTGILRLLRPRDPDRTDDEEYFKNLYFLNGQLVDVRTHPFQAAECLGRVLQRAGRVDQKTVVESLKRSKQKGEKQGQTLISMGVLSSGLLELALQSQLEVKLTEIFTWERVHYNFVPREKFSKAVARIDSHLPYILFNIIWKRFVDTDIIARLDRFKENFIGKTTDPIYSIADFHFQDIMGKFWTEILDKDNPFKRILIISNLKHEKAYKALFGLWVLGMIQFMEKSREDPLALQIERLKEQLKTAEKRNHFENLSVHWSADTDKIEKAWIKKRHEYQEQIRSSTGIIESMYENILERVRKAYEEVRDTNRRRAYREKIFDEFFLEFNSDIFRQKGESFLFTKQNYDQAIEELLSAIEVYPTNGEYFAALGLSMFYKYYPEDTTNVIEARELIQKGVDRARRSDVVHLCQGLMYKKEGKASKAIESFKKALKIKPDNRFVKIEMNELVTGKVATDRESVIKAFVGRKRVVSDEDIPATKGMKSW